MTVKKMSNGSGNRMSEIIKQRNCKSDLERSSNTGRQVGMIEKDKLFLKCKILNHILQKIFTR